MKNIHINTTILSEIDLLLLEPDIDREAIKIKLELFEEEVQELLKKISNTKNFNDVETDFKKLVSYQLTGAKLYFKHDFDISKRLEIFIREFDRMDDLKTLKNLFDTIKRGRYF